MYTVPESWMIKFMRRTKLIWCKSVQQSGHVPAAAQMPSAALTHELSFTSTTVSQQLVFPLFLTGNGPRITADWLQWAPLSLDPPGKHPAASVMHMHTSQAAQRSPKQQPLSARWVGWPVIAPFLVLSLFSPVTQLRSSHPAGSNPKNN